MGIVYVYPLPSVYLFVYYLLSNYIKEYKDTCEGIHEHNSCNCLLLEVLKEESNVLVLQCYYTHYTYLIIIKIL